MWLLRQLRRKAIIAKKWVLNQHRYKHEKGSRFRDNLSRYFAGSIAIVFLFTFALNSYLSKEAFNKYDLSQIEELLLEDPVELYDQKLVIDSANERLVYNEGYQPGVGTVGHTSAPKFTAVFNSGADKSVEVTDPVNNMTFSLNPMFKLDSPQKNRNRVVYPIVGKKASKVFTLKGSAIKEDIVLFSNQGNEIEFDYEMGLPDGSEARMEGDGSIGVYGPSTELLGNITTATEEDAELLQKAREASEKNNLLFTIPAPFIVEAYSDNSKAKSWFSLQENSTVLRVHASNLDQATYPLSIDPSVYIETARKLMRGNNETNIDFNVTNELIQKGSTTGARFDSWDETLALNEGRWNGGAAVSGGFIYYVGGASEGGIVKTVYNTSGSDTFVVPAGITDLNIKSWGAGGGGGGASPDRVGGNGAGAGYAASTISVTPSETLTVRIGGAGAGGTGFNSGTDSGNGGGGGGYSGILRSGTPLIIAAGGGGGGGANADSGSTARAPGSDAGAGGGNNGTAGNGNGNTTGGTGGTLSSGGTGGVTGGANGSPLVGGNGGSPNGTPTGGGTNGGGGGGIQQNGGGPNKRPGGGGAGAGYFGGGGGGGRNDRYNGGAGGAGGSSYTTGSPATSASGSGLAAANNSDADRSGAGSGGAGGAVGTTGTSGSNGLVVISYATGGGGAVNDDIYFAQLNETTGAIENANPGSGTCVNWCTSAVYSLPEERQGHTLTSYNGFLYVIGGEDDAGTRKSTVLIAKLGINGEPQLWHPTDSNKNNWVYWFEDTASALTSERTYHATAAYNNKIYLFGGQNNANSGGINTVETANIEPNGTLDSWTTTGTTSLPSVRYGHDIHIYNDYVYLVGGNSNGTLQSAVDYLKLSDDGTMNAWVATNSFTTPRMSWGGTSSTIWGGYLYVSGGCIAVDGNGMCSSVANETQLASINADGTITDWGEIIGLNNLRMGHSFISWRNAIYGLGGCNSQNPANGQCVDLILTNDKGVINQDGDASTVSNSQSSGSGNCTGADPFDCDIPPAGSGNGQGGQMAGGAVVNNGFVYYIGGCYVSGAGNLCSQGGGGRTASSTSYAAIGTDGTLHRATCTGANKQYYGSWCVDNSNTINAGNGLAAFGFTVFNNTIYAIGGTTGSAWQSNVWRTTLAADGSLSTWTSQTFTNAGLGAAKGYQYVFSRANPSSAGTFPGNLYVVGGCNGNVSGLDCNDVIYSDVYKCKISTTGALGTGSDACTTTGQLQIDSEPGIGGNQGLGIMAGTVYANYIYLIGGQSPNEAQRGEVIYAKINDSNNIVAASGSTWVTSPNELSPERRRGVAFGYNGYLYGLAGFADETGLQDLLLAKIDVSDGSIGTFATSQVTVNPRWDLRAVVSSGYVYTLGGCSSGEPPAECLDMTSTVQTFQLYNNYSGSNTNYTTSSNLFATDRLGMSATVHDGYIYAAGGCTSSTDCTTATNSVQYAPLNADGSIGTWVATTANLPAVRAFGQLESVGGSLYFIGGQDSGGTAQTTVYYATPSSGNVSTWSTASNGLPAARTELSASVWNDRIYVTGGRNGATRQTTVYQSPDLGSGGNISSAWSSTTGFNVARAGHTAISYAGNLYTLGGHDGTNYLNDVQYAKINSDGTVGTWGYTTSLPQRIRNSDGFAANGYMYLFGGRSADTTCTANTYIAPISANTTIASGNNPTGVGEWYQTRAGLTGNTRYGAAAVYNEGKTYVLGGGCGSTLTYTGANRVLYATLQSQPQVARYSRMIDTDSDVFPTKWLMNGLDNSVGARWYTQYQSSTDANNEWGQVTDFGTVTLGNVEDYVPLDGSGTNTEFARYFYFSISIDSSKAYGYPDDVTRGPTIDDLTLFFTSDPNKRLRHGKTFTGGQQQPLDTPPPN